ncbi:helix-turn-helix domain-containing protein [Allokutzneria sp. A3M-2-11 16]|uniref:GbsR/MarR family transcriptional regulator n=1 Tax=Allokutzneria sp. A3M-2-11 16 TaxID=2962043 RepID=UPI0020B6F064|nr:MarR family transcriptional regulator [Allokutzneria sp. A3M-2-11 16]MCP3798373.1 helix-turn-helix domain-containing protein [Allokutzneria sp. A3M-2-11 16]
MPGGRLTDQDRRRIAAGLAEGLGFAEIARQLDRPTSTVSREVARNGGAADYRSDQARTSTWRRARRRKPTVDPVAPSTDQHGRDPREMAEFTEQFVALMVQSGLPRMAARVLAALVTTDSGTLTAAELVRLLVVSPASVSKSVAYLEGLELVRREREGPRARERYLIDDDVWLQTWMTSARTNLMLAETAQRGVEVFDPATPAGARLDHMARFFAKLGEDMTGGGLTPSIVRDVLTVLAALVHAGPLAVDALAHALGWPEDRVVNALRDAEKHPDLAGPVAVSRTENGDCAAVAAPDRLTAAQRDALSAAPRAPRNHA